MLAAAVGEDTAAEVDTVGSVDTVAEVDTVSSVDMVAEVDTAETTSCFVGIGKDMILDPGSNKVAGSPSSLAPALYLSIH